MHLTICTSPDLGYAISMINRSMSNPAKEYWNVVKWVFLYLKGSVCLPLCFNRDCDKSALLKGFMITCRNTSYYSLLGRIMKLKHAVIVSKCISSSVNS